MTDDNITKLPVKFKRQAPEGRTLLAPWEVAKPTKCHHKSFVVDQALDHVECAECGEKLNPMWVLNYLAVHDRKYQQAAERYRDEVARLAERERTKCNHCGKMTRISRR